MNARLTEIESRFDAASPTLAIKSDLASLSTAIAGVRTSITEAEDRSTRLVFNVAAAGITLIISILTFVILAAKETALVEVGPSTTSVPQPVIIIVLPDRGKAT